jgi:hypothetical protein
MDKRFIDVALRHGVSENTPPKWKKYLELKDYFDQKIGRSIYEVLPKVVENTFGVQNLKAEH